MPLPMASQEVSRDEFFPYIPETITDTTFPFNLNVTTSSDLILVKCPHTGYRHTNESDMFKAHDYLFFPSQLGEYYELINWVPLLKNPSEPTNIICGRVSILQPNEMHKTYNWIFNVIWENVTIAKNITERRYISDTIPITHENCKMDSEQLVEIITMNKTGTFKRVDDVYNITGTYVNQKFYYFRELENKDKLREPCFIYRAFQNSPDITLSNKKPVYNKEKKIYIINTDDEEKVEDIKVELKLKDASFYEGEQITLTRMRYLEKGITAIDNSDTWITSKFTIKGFELVKLTYNYEGEKNWEVITKTFYFGPTLKYYNRKEIVAYDKNETTVRPNCTLLWKTIGYLKEITYNNKNISVKDLNEDAETMGKFENRDGFIFLKAKNEFITTLACIYQTPVGIYSVSIEFQAGTKEYIEDHEGNLIPTIKVIHPNATSAEALNEMEKKLKESQKSLYEKLKDKVGEINAILILVGIILVITIILLIPLVFLYIRIFSPCFKMIKHKRSHPNIYQFWDMITSGDFKTYCKNISSKKYIAEKLLTLRSTTRMEGGEVVEYSESDPYDGELMLCYRKLPKTINANYLYTDALKRRYILCDGPTKDTEIIFWKMVYQENVGTIVAITDDNKINEDLDNIAKNLYWTTSTEKYDDITVTYETKIKLKVLSVSGHRFTIGKSGGPSKTFELFHISKWKENDIPQSDLQFVNLYDKVLKNAQGKNIIIHSSQSTGSRVYMLTYFVCICDAMICKKQFNNPLDVIKKIREKRFGGAIGKYEFAFVIKALVSTFFKNNILIDFSKRRLDFIKNCDEFFYEFLRRKSKINDNIREFLNYVNILDEEKIKSYKNEVFNLGRIKDENELNKRCKCFLNALENTPPIRIRYKDIKCFDSSLVTVQEQKKSEATSFIHANKFEYKTNSNKTRKLILCQAPLDSTLDDMMDMIFKYKVTVLVVLIRPEEVKEGKWYIYYPQSHSTVFTKHYFLTRTGYKDFDKDGVAESEMFLDHKESKELFKFHILHYKRWPDKGVPSNHKDIYELYKRINGFGCVDYTAIHCSAGIGRTGALALALYLIDTVNMFQTFDPLARLATLRQHRYLAVQKYNQFIFALLVLFERYRIEIEEMNEQAFDKFYKIAQEIFKEEEEINKGNVKNEKVKKENVKKEKEKK